ncbi:EF-Hand 1, calcium-binding site,EF-hand domain pair,EF-hand domain [Cinara cedri]|uniref:EF-Hand 1, calcium-binding site,EF-hand domain pair,EF-hand domain n=1 Tax=Cinara cedri TaxID=506608 RepID=A0A5E4MMG4_9HEMI|nr:EF-Hand 1, calcium-binding site,EF-hand domain pair,EF-hand domain [Cinara cedri]
MAVNRLLVLEITFLMILAVVNSYPAFGNNEYKHKNKDKGRTIRGFKNMDLSTARGFGKRAEHYALDLLPSDIFTDNKDERFNNKRNMQTARGFGKRADNYATNLLPSDTFTDNKDDGFNQNMQMDESLETMIKNKYSARNDLKNLIENVLDRNHDGLISIEEWMQAMQQNDGES